MTKEGEPPRRRRGVVRKRIFQELPPLFEPDQEPPNRDAVVFQGTVHKDIFHRTLQKLRPPLHRRGEKVRAVPARVEVAVSLDTRDDSLRLRPYDTHKHPHQADFPVVSATVFESQNRLEGSEALRTNRPAHEASTGQRTKYKVRPKRRASRVHIFDADQQTRRRGGNPRARVRKTGGFFTTWRPG
jgi:hypothetical protein